MKTLLACALLTVLFNNSSNASTIYLSTDVDSTIGGTITGADDVAAYDSTGNIALLHINGMNFTAATENIDAIHVLPSGSAVLSTTTGATIGGLSFSDHDLVAYNPTTDTSILYFDGSLITGTATDIDAVSILDNGHFLLSTTSDASLGGLLFNRDDVVEYDPGTGTASLVFDGISVFNSTAENIDAISWLSNDSLLFSTTGSASIGALNFLDGDLIEYNLLTGASSVFFSENDFLDNFDITAVDISTANMPSVPLPASVWLFMSGLIGITATARRSRVRVKS